MSNRKHIILLGIGFLIIFCALAAISYAFWPMPDNQVQITIPATLFTPPP
jgi:hypothetical protein